MILLAGCWLPAAASSLLVAAQFFTFDQKKSLLGRKAEITDFIGFVSFDWDAQAKKDGFDGFVKVGDVYEY